ncbi:MAG: hypothetical protein GHCLOJNM_01572 [bacterium]|nr:hypothetical protein [bacterium]
MARGQNVSFKGGVALAIDKITPEQVLGIVRSDLKKQFRKWLKLVRDDAARRSPVDPDSRHAKGETRFPAVHNADSIKYGLSQKFAGGRWFTTSGRGGWIEVGTQGSGKHRATPAQPYLRPAVEANISSLQAMVRESVGKSGPASSADSSAMSSEEEG